MNSIKVDCLVHGEKSVSFFSELSKLINKPEKNVGANPVTSQSKLKYLQNLKYANSNYEIDVGSLIVQDSYRKNFSIENLTLFDSSINMLTNIFFQMSSYHIHDSILRSNVKFHNDIILICIGSNSVALNKNLDFINTIYSRYPKAKINSRVLEFVENEQKHKKLQNNSVLTYGLHTRKLQINKQMSDVLIVLFKEEMNETQKTEYDQFINSLSEQKHKYVEFENNRLVENFTKLVCSLVLTKQDFESTYNLERFVRKYLFNYQNNLIIKN